jgi:signal transduction histidine kinase
VNYQLDQSTRLRLNPKIFFRNWRINLDYFYIFGIIASVLGVLNEETQGDALRQDVLWLITKGLSMAALYLFWLSSSKVLSSRNRTNLTIFQILALGAAGGAFHTFIHECLTWLFLLKDNSTDFQRYFSSGIFAAIWLPAASVTMTNFSKYRKLRDSIKDQMLEMEVLNLARNRLRTLDEGILRKQISELVAESQTKASMVLADALDNASNNNLPQMIRGLASDHLRLLAHEISELTTQTEPRKRWWLRDQTFQTSFLDAIVKSISARPLNAEWFTIVALATIALPLLRRDNWKLGLFLLAMGGLVTYIIQKGGFYLYAKVQKAPKLQAVFTTVLNVSLPLLFAANIPGNDPNLHSQIQFAVVIVFITCFGHLAQSGLIHQEELLSLEKLTLQRVKSESAVLNLELARITKDWAKHIHSTVQSRLHAFSIILEQAQLRDDLEVAERAIEEIRRTLEDMNKEQHRDLIVSLDAEIKRRCELWNGIANIDIEIDPESNGQSDARIMEICECLTEAITNSVRHGAADLISVQLLSRKDNNVLKVVDNGAGPRQVVQGLGSKTFDSLTNKNWSLHRDALNGQTILTLHFATMA